MASPSSAQQPYDGYLSQPETHQLALVPPAVADGKRKLGRSASGEEAYGEKLQQSWLAIARKRVATMGYSAAPSSTIVSVDTGEPDPVHEFSPAVVDGDLE